MERNRAVAGPEVHAHALDLPSDQADLIQRARTCTKPTRISTPPPKFDEVGAEIASALDHFSVPGREKGGVFVAIVARKAEVVDP
jgi:hypothetical protein